MIDLSGPGCSNDGECYSSDVNHYPADKKRENQLRYPLDRDLSSGQSSVIYFLNNWGLNKDDYFK